MPKNTAENPVGGEVLSQKMNRRRFFEWGKRAAGAVALGPLIFDLDACQPQNKPEQKTENPPTKGQINQELDATKKRLLGDPETRFVSSPSGPLLVGAWESSNGSHVYIVAAKAIPDPAEGFQSGEAYETTIQYTDQNPKERFTALVGYTHVNGKTIVRSATPVSTRYDEFYGYLSTNPREVATDAQQIKNGVLTNIEGTTMGRDVKSNDMVCLITLLNDPTLKFDEATAQKLAKVEANNEGKIATPEEKQGFQPVFNHYPYEQENMQTAHTRVRQGGIAAVRDRIKRV